MYAEFALRRWGKSSLQNFDRYQNRLKYCFVLHPTRFGAGDREEIIKAIAGLSNRDFRVHFCRACDFRPLNYHPKRLPPIKADCRDIPNNSPRPIGTQWATLKINIQSRLKAVRFG